MVHNKILVGFMGGPCTGKTTITRFVQSELSTSGAPTATAMEFVTEDIKRHGPPDLDNQVFEQVRYYMNQCWEEERAMTSADVVLTDSPTFFSYIYALFAKKNARSERHTLALKDLETCFKRDTHRYDKIYLLRREFPYEENGVRFHSLEQAMAVDRLIEQLLTEHGVPFTWLEGTVAERGHKVVSDIKNLLEDAVKAA